MTAISLKHQLQTLLPQPRCYTEAVALSFLKEGIGKKLLTAGDNNSQEAAALEKFFQCQRGIIAKDREGYPHDITWRIRRKLCDLFSGYDSRRAYERFSDVGPGASRLCDGVDWYSKHSGRMSTTSFYCYSRYLQTLRSCDAIDGERLRLRTFGVTRVGGGRISFVPKDDSIHRIICTEPLANSMFQFAIGRFMEERLRSRWGLDISTQPNKNRRFARFGSTTGLFSTIDLRSASDTISLALCRAILPPEVLCDVERARSPLAHIPDGRTVRLAMVSTMGNAFTFPLQTAIFAACCQVVMEDMDVRYRRRGALRYAVFGDDIIVPSVCDDALRALLGSLGFTVNPLKSFSTGPFRESCGEDYWYGLNVRSVFIKDLDTPQGIVVAINRLHRWSRLHHVPLFRLQLFLRRRLLQVCSRPIPFVPYDSGDSTGIQSSRRRAILSGAKPLGHGLVKYSYWFPVRQPSRKIRQDNPWLQFVAMGSGRVTSTPDGDIQRYSSRRTVIVKVRRKVTSVWPSGFVTRS